MLGAVLLTFALAHPARPAQSPGLASSFAALLAGPIEFWPPEREGENIVIDEKAKSVIVPAVVAKQGVYDVLKGAIEYVLVSRGGKDYEALFLTECTPEEIHGALLKVGLKPGNPAHEEAPPRGARARILVEYEQDGKKVHRPVDEFVLNMKTDRPLEATPWPFTGSTKVLDPETDKEVLQCMLTKSIVGLHYTDPSSLLQNPRPEGKNENIYKADLKALPGEGRAVRLIFERVMPRIAEGTKRTRVFVSGRVQGVGFREFTQLEARKRDLTGFVQNLADGRVEVVIEGPAQKVDELVERLKRGPRAAAVKDLEAKQEPPEGDFENFEILKEPS